MRIHSLSALYVRMGWFHGLAEKGSLTASWEIHSYDFLYRGFWSGTSCCNYSFPTLISTRISIKLSKLTKRAFFWCSDPYVGMTKTKNVNKFCNREEGLETRTVNPCHAELVQWRKRWHLFLCFGNACLWACNFSGIIGTISRLRNSQNCGY